MRDRLHPNLVALLFAQPCKGVGKLLDASISAQPPLSSWDKKRESFPGEVDDCRKQSRYLL